MRSGLLHIHEFTLTEVENFCYPFEKTRPKYETVKDVRITFLSHNQQTNGLPAQSMTEHDECSLILNQIHAYYITRTHIFMLECGVLPTSMCFLQYLNTKMAHYAAGWLGIVSI